MVDFEADTSTPLVSSPRTELTLTVESSSPERRSSETPPLVDHANAETELSGPSLLRLPDNSAVADAADATDANDATKHGIEDDLPPSSPATGTDSLIPMKFGDIISLNVLQASLSGYLSADPCFERVGFTQTHHDLSHSHRSDCLFQVVPMLSYDNKASKAKLERRGSFSTEESLLVDLRIQMEEAKNKRQMKVSVR